MASGQICPRRFGTSSPMTIDTYVMTTTTSTVAPRLALPGFTPSPISHWLSGCANAASPTMPLVMPIDVMPT